jgi:AraC-like DNA-binding protein
VPVVLRELGCDPPPVLTASGLPPDALDDAEGMIPYVAAGRLMQQAALHSACPHFGMLIGQRLRVAMLGLIGQLMRNAPTLGVALRDFATHQHRHARGAVVYLLARQEDALLGYAVYQPGVVGSDQITDGAAYAALSIVLDLVGPHRADQAELLFTRGEPADLAPYRRGAAAKLRFNADHTGVLMPADWLTRPVLGADPALRCQLETQVQQFAPAGPLDVVTQVNRALRIGLMTGRISEPDLATSIGISRRTLHRRLDADGAGFQDLLDAARFEFARQLLENTQIGIGEISLILRYADPSVFTRAFSRWSGTTPSGWRAEQRQHAALLLAKNA